jgi:acetyl esterase
VSAPTVLPAPPPPVSGWKRLALPAFVAFVKASLRFSPRPTALLIRRQYARSGARTKADLDRHAPAGIATFLDEHYAEHPDARLDVYVPADAAASGAPLPTVVWIHGGGWLGGAKEEIAGYLKMIAAHGFTAVAIRYSLAPGARYPTPVRQTMGALDFLDANAARLHVDPARLFLAGDSAGAQIAAQVAALVTNPMYVREVGVTPTIDADQLRGVALCCGPYDPALARDTTPFDGFLTTVLWSYSGTRDWRSNRYFATSAVTGHVTAAFPPAFVTVGNADPLRAHSTVLAAALEAAGVEVDSLFFPPDHQPPLAHEYQFHLDLADAHEALTRLIAFLEGHA